MKKPSSFAVAAAAAAAIAGMQAGAASAAPTLSTPLACWIATGSNPEFPVVGGGFSPLSYVLVEYSDGASQVNATTDATGAFSATLAATTVRDLGEPQTVIVQAKDDGVLASFSVPLVYRGGGVATASSTLNGQLASQRTPWEFGGYPGGTIFAHFSYSESPSGPYRPLVTTRFGATTGPCGTLSVRRPLFQGIKVRDGWWHVQFDSSPRYHRAAKGSLVWCGTVLRVGTGGRAGMVLQPRHGYVQLSPCAVN